MRTPLKTLLGVEPTKKGKPFNGAQAVPIEIWGWRFLDLDHQSALRDDRNGKKRTMAQLKVGHGRSCVIVKVDAVLAPRLTTLD